MTAPILSVRVSRRAVAGAVLSGEQLAFFDGRHLRSGREAAAKAIARYARVLLEQARPSTVVIDCPMKESSATPGLVSALRQVFADAGVATHDVQSAELLRAFGAARAPTRIELRRMVEPFFPELAPITLRVKPHLLDAAACALFVESAAALGTLGT